VVDESFRRHGLRLAALVPLFLLFALARDPAPDAAARSALAAPFRFTRTRLPVLTPSSRTIRGVRPSLAPIAAWISSVGAGVALNDLDGDGQANDVVYVDVRSDEVVMAPIAGAPGRFAPFDLLRASGAVRLPATAPMGATPIDLDEDGRLDVVVHFWGRSPVAFYRRGAGMTAADFEARELVSPRAEWYSNAATFADVDGDGHADLLVGNYFPDGAQVLDPRGTSRAMQMQDSMSRAFNGGADRILLHARNAHGEVVFRDASYALPPHVAQAWTLAIGAQDLDGDLLPELYFANDFGPDRLLRNHSLPGRPAFELVVARRGFFEPKSKVLGRDSFKGMGVDFADLDGDARPDIFVSNITDPYALEESNFAFLSGGGGVSVSGTAYHDASEPLGLSRSGWGWDARFGDFDNDGGAELVQATGFVKGTIDRWPELHELAMGNDTLLHRERAWPRFEAGADLSGFDRNPFYVRDRDGRFHDVAHELGIDTNSISRGIATADVDGDGRLDFAIANQWNGSELFRNSAPHPGNFLLLDLRLPVAATGTTTIVARAPIARVPSSAAIGATVRVLTPGRIAIAQVDGGNGHSGKRSHQIHVGLGDARAAEVEVRWRDRTGKLHATRMHLAAGAHTLLLANGLLANGLAPAAPPAKGSVHS
jgi:hypothetical protein